MPTICQECVDKVCLKVKNPRFIKPCDKVEAILRKEKIYAREYTRPRLSPQRVKKEDNSESNYLREIPVENIEDTAYKRAEKLKFGTMKPKRGGELQDEQEIRKEGF